MRRITLGLTLVTVLCLGAQSSVGADDPPVHVTEVLKTTTALDGGALTFPKAKKAEMVSHVVEVPPQTETGWHKHPGPAFMYILEGTLVLHSHDGATQEFHAGEALVEDADTWFNNTNPGDTPVKFVGVIVHKTGEEPVEFKEPMRESQ